MTNIISKKNNTIQIQITSTSPAAMSPFNVDFTQDINSLIEVCDKAHKAGVLLTVS